MAKDPKKRQKKLEQKKAKRKEKRHELAKASHQSIPDQMKASTRYPILHCFMSGAFWSEGMGQILVSRELPGRQVAVASFLVDRYCLGIKDALADVGNRSAYEKRFMRRLRGSETEELEPSKARKIVEDAVEYAQKLGFSPHPDYHRAKLIFGDVKAEECTEEFEFGKDGKPLYISGPNDTPERIQQIINTLTISCGEGNFHSVMASSPGFRVRPSRPSQKAIESEEEAPELEHEEASAESQS